MKIEVQILASNHKVIAHLCREREWDLEGAKYATLLFALAHDCAPKDGFLMYRLFDDLRTGRDFKVTCFVNGDFEECTHLSVVLREIDRSVYRALKMEVFNEGGQHGRDAYHYPTSEALTRAIAQDSEELRNAIETYDAKP